MTLDCRASRLARKNRKPRHSILPSRRSRNGRRSAPADSCSAPDSSFISSIKGYADFDAFLADLASRKRKMIRRERKEALADGITIELLTGADIKEAPLGRVFSFLHGYRRAQMGHALSHPRIFLRGRRGDERAYSSRHGQAQWPLLSLARSISSARMRSTGAIGGPIEEHPFLHFEVCYYQAIEFAISRGLTRVEAGAQGEHKLARGYRAVATFSAHDIGDKRFARAIDDYLQRERLHVDEALARI